MAVINDDFKHDYNYDIKTGFVRVRYGANRSVLEVELNEMQKIQEEGRASAIRNMVPTGFFELVRPDILSDYIVCNPNNEELTFAIAPSKLMLSGYEVAIEGDTTINGKDGYLKIKLNNGPPKKRSDFVFLEFWFELLSEKSLVRKYGYEKGQPIENKLVDSRVNEETSRRVALRWRYRVEDGVEFDKWTNGFGYNNSNDFSPIYAHGPNGNKVDKLDYVFKPASHELFKDKDFFKDSGLWVAGNTDGSSEYELNILENYVYAVPLFQVNRRSVRNYDIYEHATGHPNGASKWDNSSSTSTHPDGLFHNIIIEEDLIDLRRTISLDNINFDMIAQKTLKEVLNGQLDTNKREVMHRAQFGIPLITMGTNSNIILISRFNQSTRTENNLDATILGDTNLKYSIGTIGDGLVLNGRSAVKYKDVTGLSGNIGTIEFFLRPFWNSADIDVNQSIFSVLDDTLGKTVFEFKKVGQNLVFTVIQDNTNSLGSQYDTFINLNNHIIQSKKIHHFKITWNFNTKLLSIYIDGNVERAITNQFNGTTLNPDTLKIGNEKEKDDANYYGAKYPYIDTVIDELVLYKGEVTNFYQQLDGDFGLGNATIYPSFNNSLRSFKDNVYEQTDLVKRIITVDGSNNIQLSAPYGTVLSTTPPKVYKSNGEVLDDRGSWVGLGTSSATFTMNSGANFVDEESVFVKYSVLIPSGNGAFELPTKILKSEINIAGNPFEISFNKVNSEPREAKLINPTTVLSKTDKAFDYSTNRGIYEGKASYYAFARLLYHNIRGDGQNTYYIPSKLYGYDVVGVRSVNKRYDSIRNLGADDPNRKFEVRLNQAVTLDDVVEFQLELGGLTFDYETHSKTIVSNMLRTYTFSAIAPGNTREFNFTLDVDSGYGIVIAASVHDQLDQDGKRIITDSDFVAYVNSIMTKSVATTGFGTPFIKIVLPQTPLVGTKIEFTVLATYSPRATDTISVWYKHVPYQGIMNNKNQKLKRLSNWIPFVTTLSSGKIVDNNLPAKSINNAINRLPGGNSYSHVFSSESLDIAGSLYSSYNGLNSNNYFITFNGVRNSVSNSNLDSNFNQFDTEFIVKKGQSSFQDGKLEAPFNLSGFMLPVTNTAINKYAGTCCLVSTEDGELMLFVFGHGHDFQKTTNTFAKPVYGDLYRIKGRPTIVKKY